MKDVSQKNLRQKELVIAVSAFYCGRVAPDQMTDVIN
jgi:hypothetical protein